jgi:hypothetical protein
MMVGVAGPTRSQGENSGPASSGPAAGAAPSADELYAQATAATGAASSTSGASEDTYPIYGGMANVVTDQYGDVRRGLYNPRVISTQNATQYAQFIIGLQATNPALYKQYQTMLYKSGYYTGKPVYGTYTGADGRAIQAMINDYEQYNTSLIAAGAKQVTPVDYMQRQIKIGGNALSGAGGPAKQPLTVQYTDPASLKATLQSAAQDALGRNLTDGELSAFVSKFHGEEKTQQTAAYNNASSVTPPDAGAQAQADVLGQHGPEHDQKLASGYLDSIAQQLGVL